MCLYTKIIENRRFKPNKKNNGYPEKAIDERVKAVAVGCGKCIECKKQKAREWQVRLNEEILESGKVHFMTMTFSDEALEKSTETDPNKIAAAAITQFRKDWYKKYKETIKHWLVTELGHDNTERLHLHGFLWTDKTCDKIEEVWKNGWVDTGEYVNEKSVGYCVKYVSKVDEKHPDFVSKVFASKGLGIGYLKKHQANQNKFNGKETKEYYKTPSGIKLALPKYYRNKLYSEKEREQLWINMLDKNKRYVRGEEIDISTSKGWKEYYEAVKYRQRENVELGYSEQPWRKIEYIKSRKKLGI